MPAAVREMSTKRCRDCRHVVIEGDRATCLHPDVAEWLPDYLDGTERLLHPSISIARGIGACGRAGRLWEPSN